MDHATMAMDQEQLRYWKHPQPMNEPPTLDFDFDTMTVGQALRWFKAVAMILICGMAAGLIGLFGVSLNDSMGPQDSLDYEN